MLRDKLLARMADMGDSPDYRQLAEEVLGVRGAPPDLARRLVDQALVVEDRRTTWQRAGERICRAAPAAAGVYVLRDSEGTALYVGKAINLRRRLRAHFSSKRWQSLKPELSRAANAEWTIVGSELEALLREAMLIAKLKPAVNVQIGSPGLLTRVLPRALVRDVVVVVPSAESDSVELVAARVDGPVAIQRTRRNGADLAVHSRRILKFFRGVLMPVRFSFEGSTVLAPLVFSWLVGRGANATRLDPAEIPSAKELANRLAALFRDERLFHERLEQW